MRTERIVLAGVIGLWPVLALAEQPLSAIDWLSKSVTEPVVYKPATPAKPAEPGISPDTLPKDVTVSVLGGASPDAVGILAASSTGLPQNLWGTGQTRVIAAEITAGHLDLLPTLEGLLITVLIARADAPADAGPDGILLRARIDKLLAMGALDQAGALTRAAKPDTVELFRRAFDIALLTGAEDQACAAMADQPNLAPTFPARIFCLARAGDWNAAALTLRTGQSLGLIDAEDEAVLSRFLDTEADEAAINLPKPERTTPLTWRIYEAVGEPLPTQDLPLAFAYADLSEQAGWKSQLEAAERLVRGGALSDQRLFGIYGARQPAASGGVWDRVEAVQEFDVALASGDDAGLSDALPFAWARMTEAELEVPFARHFGPALIRRSTGRMDALMFRVALLSGRYADAVAGHTPTDATEMFLAGLARGDVSGLPATDGMGRAIAPAFSAPDSAASEVAPDAQALLDDQRTGEAVLWAIDRISGGVRGDLRGVAEGLVVLRKLGLEDAARRTALELMLLERRG